MNLVRASVISDLVSEQAFVHVEERILGKIALLHKFLKEPFLYNFLLLCVGVGERLCC